MRILNKRTLVFFCFIFIAGILAASFFHADYLQSIWIAIIAGGICTVLLIVKKARICILLIFAFCLGNFLFVNQMYTDFSNIEPDATYKITGRICDYPDKSAENARYILSDVTLQSGNATIQFPKRVLLRTPDKSFEYGDILTFDAKVHPPRGETMPNSFNNHIYIATKHVGFSAYSDAAIKKGYQWMPYELFVHARSALETNIDNTHSAQTAPIAKAIFLGIMNEIPDEISTSFANTGIVHILSVSGLHISAVVLIINLLLGRIRMKRNYKFLFCIIGLLLYTSVTGFPISVIRAALMTIFILIARWRFADRDMLIFLSGAMLATLVFNPAQLFMPGFLLSYGSVFGILCLYPPLYRLLNKKETESAENALGMLSVSISATASTFPVTAYYFNNVTLISPLTNFIAIPVSTVVLATTGLAAITAFIHLSIGKFFAVISESLIKFLIIINNTISQVNFGFLKIYSFTVWMGIAVFSAIFILSDYLMVSRVKKLLLCCIVLGTAFFPMVFSKTPDKFEIVFLDVGYGEAVHIKYDDKNILISNATSGAAYNINSYSNRNGIQYDMFILTESNPSHTGGAADILNNGSVMGTFVCNMDSSELNDICKAKGIAMQTAQKYDTLYSYNDLEITVLQDNYNALSLMVKKSGKNICLLSGHSAKRSKDLTASAPIFRVASEGNESSINQSFLSTVSPAYAVISVSESNQYGLPNKNALALLAGDGVAVYRTDRDYTITMTIDESENITVRTMHED